MVLLEHNTKYSQLKGEEILGQGDSSAAQNLPGKCEVGVQSLVQEKKGKGVSLGSWFQEIPSMASWLQGNNFMAEGRGRPKLLSSWCPRSSSGE